MSRPLSDALPLLSAALRAGHPLLLFCDFDGTLVEINDTPFDVFPLPTVQAALARIAAHPQATVAIVSGRDLADLKPRVGVDGIAYAGNHGLEIHGAGFEFTEPTADSLRAALNEIVTQLADAVRTMPGAWVQFKGLTATVHHRQTPADAVPELTATVQRLIAPYTDRFALKTGKMVLEVRPLVDWHKGHAVHWLTERFAIDHPEPIAVFLGDDVTDEDAFAMLPHGVTVLVGPPRPTAARYRVDQPTDVAAFLGWLDRELTGGEAKAF